MPFSHQQKLMPGDFRIGLASRKEGIETSIYINPTVFSREDWMEDNLSFMSKYRIRPGHDGDETRNRVLH